MLKFRVLQLPLLVLALISQGSTQFAHTDHQQIVDATGKPLLLRATSLGNWLVPEGYMWLFQGGPQSPSEIRALVLELLGPEGRPCSGRSTARTTLRVRTSRSSVGPGSTPFEFLCITACLKVTTRKASSCWIG